MNSSGIRYLKAPQIVEPRLPSGGHIIVVEPKEITKNEGFGTYPPV